MTPWCSWRSVSDFMVAVLYNTQPMTLGRKPWRPADFAYWSSRRFIEHETDCYPKTTTTTKKSILRGSGHWRQNGGSCPSNKRGLATGIRKWPVESVLMPLQHWWPPPLTPTHTHKHTHSHTTPKTPTLNGSLAHIPNLSALTDGRDWSAKPGSLLSLLRAHLRQFVSHKPGDQRQPLTTLQPFSRVSGVCNKPPDGVSVGGQRRNK